MFYKNFVNHRKKFLHLLKIKNIYLKNVYCKLQIKSVSYMLLDLKKIHALMIKVLKSI